MFGLILVAAPLVADTDGWTVTILNHDSTWKNVVAEDVNARGTIVGWWESKYDPDDIFAYQLEGLVWKNRKSDPVSLDPLEDETMSVGYCINRKGEVGGYSAYWRDIGGNYWFWRTAVIWDHKGNPESKFPTTVPGALNTEIWGINNAGDAVGGVGIGGYWNAFRWWADGTEELLAKTDDDISDDGLVVYASRCHSINEKGVACGVEWERDSTAFTEQRAVYWTADGEVVNLQDELEKVESDILGSMAQTVNDHGEVAGLAWDAVMGTMSTKSWAWVWSPRQGVTIVTDPDILGRATMMGSGGQHFSGMVYGDGWDIDSAEPARWTRKTEKGTTIYTLDVVPMLAGYSYGVATSVNRGGKVVGYYIDSNDDARAWWAWRSAKND